jgi:hypothetical protein
MPELMKKITILLFILCLWLIGPEATHAQHTFAATGGNATGSEGTISYTLGQAACLFQNGTDGSVTQGVQQSYRVTLESGFESSAIPNLTCSLFPNPASEILTLKIHSQKFNNLTFQLMDMRGHLLFNQKINSSQTTIPVNGLAAGTYLMRIIHHGKPIKTFKLIVSPSL